MIYGPSMMIHGDLDPNSLLQRFPNPVGTPGTVRNLHLHRNGTGGSSPAQGDGHIFQVGRRHLQGGVAMDPKLLSKMYWKNHVRK